MWNGAVNPGFKDLSASCQFLVAAPFKRRNRYVFKVLCQSPARAKGKHSVNRRGACTGPVGGVSNPDGRATPIEVETLSHRTLPRFTESLRRKCTISSLRETSLTTRISYVIVYT